MTETIVKISSSSFKAGELTMSMWNELLGVIQDQFNYTESKITKLKNNKLLKLTAAIPFVAGCDNPARTAIVHISTMLLASESAKHIFLHNFQDNQSLEKRLHMVSLFDGGNKEVIKKGMNLLYLVMLSDHRIDNEMDNQNNKYNPISSKIWDDTKLIDSIIRECEVLPTTQLDKILPVEVATKIPWEIG